MDFGLQNGPQKRAKTFPSVSEERIGKLFGPKTLPRRLGDIILDAFGTILDAFLNAFGKILDQFGIHFLQ